jgi:hypothetical protein
MRDERVYLAIFGKALRSAWRFFVILKFFYNAPQVKPYERVYLAIFRMAFRLHFNDKFEPCRPRAGGQGGGGGGGTETKSFQEAVSCPRY